MVLLTPCRPRLAWQFLMPGQRIAGLAILMLIAMFRPESARAAAATFSTSPQVFGSVVISNLTGAVPPSGNPNTAPNSNVNDPRYVADDQPVQGQTFTTGNNVGGYKLTAVSLKQVSYSTFSLVPGINYTLRITRPLTTNSLSVISNGSAGVGDGRPRIGNERYQVWRPLRACRAGRGRVDADFRRKPRLVLEGDGRPTRFPADAQGVWHHGHFALGPAARRGCAD